VKRERSTRAPPGRRERVEMMTHCPHDGTPIEIEIWSGGSALVVCPTCEAEWESHGAWLRVVREAKTTTGATTRP
jgi:uncharacterized Zn finger protein (UPF0148 family)